MFPFCYGPCTRSIRLVGRWEVGSVQISLEPFKTHGLRRGRASNTDADISRVVSMLLDDLQQALSLVIGVLEAYDERRLGDSRAGIAAANAVLAYAHACCSTELEPPVACIVAEVCGGLRSTLATCLSGCMQDLERPGSSHEPNNSSLHEIPRQDYVEFSDAEDMDIAGSTAAADSVECMQQCQRTVHGSMQDVAGLE